MLQWSLEHAMMVRRVGAGRELVWLHGLGEWSVSFDAIVAHPELAGFRHVLPDLPGFGRSPWPVGVPPGQSLELLAEHLAMWLRPRPAPILIGHSMGGVLATLVGERIPVAAIVNIEGNLSRGDCTFSAQAAAYAVDDFVAYGFAALRAQVYAWGMNVAALRGYHAALTAASPVVFHRNATDLVALSATDTLAGRLAALPAPKLVIAGTPGGLCAHSLALLDSHRVPWRGIEAAGHWPFVDQPDACAKLIAEHCRAIR